MVSSVMNLVINVSTWVQSMDCLIQRLAQGQRRFFSLNIHVRRVFETSIQIDILAHKNHINSMSRCLVLREF
jgi:hypothetical protein